LQTADLHFHSTHSDGKHSVAWVIEHLGKARAGGLGLGVLTDHDIIAGYEEFSEGVNQWWTPLCASELSCTFQDSLGRERELHLLVYGLSPTESELRQMLQIFKAERSARFFKICEKLNEAGYKIDGTAFASRHPGVLGRPHVADALIEAGYASSRTDAFERFLKDSSPYFVKKWRFPLEEAVRYAKQHGCKTSIAHPGQYRFKDPELSKFKDLGVDAIEIYHPRNPISEVPYYLEAARRFGFKISGGSDFHFDQLDRVESKPSLGRTKYPLEDAKKFLGDLL
jgi:hypothetical protein